MIDSARIQTARLIDRYLADELSPEEAAEFEEHLLNNPDLQSEIELARRLKLGLATLRKRGELEGLVRGVRGPSRGPLLALAASVLIAVGISMFYLSHRGPPLLAASVEAFAPGQLVRAAVDVNLVRRRDSTRIDIGMPAADELVAIHILTGAQSAESRFDVQIARDSAETLARVEDLRADDDVVTVYFDARAAGAGDYRVRLEPQNSGSEELEPEEYLLRVGSAAQP